MTGARLAERLAEQGLDPDEIAAKAGLFESALAAFASVSGGNAPAHAWWVPGRLEVFGKHTDYGGGRTVVAAVPRGFVIVAAPRADDEVRLLDARTGDRMVLGRDPATFTGWRHYVEVVVRRLTRNFPPDAPNEGQAPHGADIVFASDLPRASGMSSSSALVVGIATALAATWNLPARDDWRRNIRDARDLAAYYACLENGLTFAGLAGDAGVGTHGGSEDHAAMLLARPRMVSAYAFVPMRHLADAAMPETWRFVIASSGVTSEKTGAAREAYNRLAEGTAVLLRLWNAHHPRCESLAMALASHDAAARELRDLLLHETIEGWPAGTLERRLDHFMAEDAAVPRGLAAVQLADAGSLGALAEASQEGAERLLGNQVPETVALARLARAAGAWAACSFGAGFGGSVWALVNAGDAGTFAADWLHRYRAAFPGRADAQVFVARPGPPLSSLGR